MVVCERDHCWGATVKRVAIVGFAPSYVDAPFADPSIAIWTMNYHHLSVPRTDRIFEMHEWGLVQKEAATNPNLAHDFEVLKTVNVPVYMLEMHPDVPTSVRYPIEFMAQKYTLANADLPYFTNTASYMIALAIEERFDEIQTYGIDMAHDTEYGHQRPSCEFFLGVAVGAGIKVTPHRLSDLLKTAMLYGYHDEKRNWFREKLAERRKHLMSQRAQHAGQFEEHKQAIQQFEGALQDLDHIAKVWG